MVRMGRSEDNDVVVGDDGVSRAHLRFENDAGVWRVVDLESTNGTEVDGIGLRPFTPAALRHGSLIRVGPIAVFEFLLSESERSAGGAETVRVAAKRTVRLTPAEAEVLELLFVHYDEGRPAPRVATVNEVAERRFTSAAAVKMVLQGLYDKFELTGGEIRNKESLVLRAQQWGATRRRF